jgi:hypothetical protein
MEAPRGRPRTFALGVWLALRSGLVRASLLLSVLCALGLVAATTTTRGPALVREIPAIASMVLTWGAGITLAFGGALRAMRRDRDEGVLLLVRSRGVSAAGYATGRVAGLVVVLAVAVGGGTLAAGLAAMAVTGDSHAVARASVAALVYALAFAATVGPLAMAALGGRTRSGGYMTLLAVLVAPELLAPWTRMLLPGGWYELTSIPAALEAVRRGVLSSSASGEHTARAIVALVAVIATSLVVVRARMPDADAMEDA